MSRNIIFTTNTGDNAVYVHPPAYGYSTTLLMAFEVKQSFSGRVIAWDNGFESDSRICNIPKMHLKADKQEELSSFFDANRGQTVRMYMGVDDDGPHPTGYFPFGPDFGDYCIMSTGGVRYFDVYIIEQEASGVLRAPWKHFNNELTLLMRDKITYTAPIPSPQGNFFIGSIGLYHPQSEVRVSHKKGLQIDVLHDGSCSVVDNGTMSDYYTAEVKLTANTANTAAIIHYLQNQVRCSNFPVTAPKNVYLFGRKNVKEDGTPNVYTCRLLSNEIEFTHVRLNKFEFTLKLMMVSRA